ncbi:unnamed protein product [Cunninghamella echinulata]
MDIENYISMESKHDNDNIMASTSAAATSIIMNNYNTSIDSSISSNYTNSNTKIRKDYTKPPTTGSFLTAACPRTGKILYFACQPKGNTKKSKALLEHCYDKNARLLSTPIRLMFEQIKAENEAYTHQLQREEKQRLKMKSKKKKTIEQETKHLWVEKYKPKTFVDLIGDQRVNRDVLRWVKQWDYCVFGKKPQVETERDKAIKQYKATFGSAGKHFDNYKKKDDSDATKDKLFRPDRKILLLSGPPGFGKTTLAHIIGKHSGYNIVEVNASDDRTGDVVKNKIKSALEMQAILRKADEMNESEVTMYTKPNMLIIDEIDGASTSGGADSFIKQLVDLASISIDQDDSKNKKKKNKQPLLRPIICICNDAYAPVLRPLRTIAQHIPFRKVPTLTIAKRLQDICDNEGLDTDLRALSLLCDMTDGDLRSCLNTLQFIRSKSSMFNKDMLNDDNLGKKDTGMSVFNTWEALFTARHSKGFQKGNQQDGYLSRIYNMIASSGETDKLMQGCFEAYPFMKFHDVALQKVVQMNNWLDFYDQLQHRSNNLHDYSVASYLPYTLVNFHRFFAGTVHQDHKMEYPRVEYEVFTKKKSFENLSNIFIAGIHPSQRRFLTRDQIILTLIPRLLRTISPELRPVNKHLIKPEEKETLSRLINVMLEYGLTFMQEKTEDGQFTYSLEPPLEEFIRFESNVSQKSVLTSRYAVRQLVAQEIEAERLRRREATFGELYKKKETKPLETKSSTKLSMKKDNSIPTDFFGRPITQKEINSTTEKLSKSSLMDVEALQVIYRYHEGYSNAVKKPMNVHMFF